MVKPPENLNIHSDGFLSQTFNDENIPLYHEKGRKGGVYS